MIAEQQSIVGSLFKRPHIFKLGNLPADRHEFTTPTRKQTRRPDVCIHVRSFLDKDWLTLGGLPVTRPFRTASDLLWDHEDPEAVANIVVGSIRRDLDHPGTFADGLAPHAGRFGLRRGDGHALLRWMIGLVGDPRGEQWMEEALAHNDQMAVPRETKGSRR